MVLSEHSAGRPHHDTNGFKGGPAPAGCRPAGAVRTMADLSFQHSEPNMTNAQFTDPPIELETAPNPTLSVIWMHGLGADGNDFPPIVPELRLPREPGIRFIFPHAPMMPITGNGGHVMRAWFDIRSFSGGSRDVDQASVLDSCELIRGLIAH